jgi:type II secretory pathway pseudopilin PulG
VKSVVKKNAFTIIELIVAMGLLVMLVGLSSVVFSTTVKAHRKATATIEITRNLRVLTEQLNADFRGLRKDVPVFMAFNWMDTDNDTVADSRFDTIHFFADGDFQTMKQYNDGVGSKTLSGNIARIFYGHANSVEPPALPNFDTWHILSRKAHILTADSAIQNAYSIAGDPYGIPTIFDSSGAIDYTLFADLSVGFGIRSFSGTDTDENELEFNTISLTQWSNALNYLNGFAPDNADAFIDWCMSDIARPYIDLEAFQTLHLLMAQGVMDFSVQWAYTPDDLQDPVTGFTAGVRWWPSVDPDGDGDETDSDFGTAGMNQDQFGVYFTLPNMTTDPDWLAIWNCGTNGVAFKGPFFPKALKFTFRLKDSNNMFPDGKLFTHIVYLDN